jgi:trimeric autotransporter adhesin
VLLRDEVPSPPQQPQRPTFRVWPRPTTKSRFVPPPRVPAAIARNAGAAAFPTFSGGAASSMAAAAARYRDDALEAAAWNDEDEDAEEDDGSYGGGEEGAHVVDEGDDLAWATAMAYDGRARAPLAALSRTAASAVPALPLTGRPSVDIHGGTARAPSRTLVSATSRRSVGARSTVGSAAPAAAAATGRARGGAGAPSSPRSPEAAARAAVVRATSFLRSPSFAGAAAGWTGLTSATAATAAATTAASFAATAAIRAPSPPLIASPYGPPVSPRPIQAHEFAAAPGGFGVRVSPEEEGIPAWRPEPRGRRAVRRGPLGSSDGGAATSAGRAFDADGINRTRAPAPVAFNRTLPRTASRGKTGRSVVVHPTLIHERSRLSIRGPAWRNVIGNEPPPTILRR